MRLSDTKLLMPELAVIIDQMLAIARKDGLCVSVFETLRSDERQEQLYRQGRSMPGPIVTKARAGSSWHNYGLAVDFAFHEHVVTPKVQWTWNGNWQRLGEIGESLGLTWLGAKGSIFPEAPHFQLTCGLPLVIARGLRSSGGLPSVWHEVRGRLADLNKMKGVSHGTNT